MGTEKSVTGDHGLGSRASDLHAVDGKPGWGEGEGAGGEK